MQIRFQSIALITADMVIKMSISAESVNQFTQRDQMGNNERVQISCYLVHHEVQHHRSWTAAKMRERGGKRQRARTRQKEGNGL